VIDFFTCCPLLFHLYIEEKSAELSRNIWMLWYPTNIIATANELKEWKSITWLLFQPLANEYK
jgi:hypothetical protein